MKKSFFVTTLFMICLVVSYWGCQRAPLPLTPRPATQTFTPTVTFTCAANLVWGETAVNPGNYPIGATYVQKYTLSQTAQVNLLAVQLSSVAAGTTLHMGIYNDNAGVPSNLIYVTSPQVGNVGLNNFVILVGNPSLAAGTYWLAVNNISGAMTLSGGNLVNLDWDISAGQDMPNPFVEAAHAAVLQSFYLSAFVNTCAYGPPSTPLPTFTMTGSPTASPTPTTSFTNTPSATPTNSATNSPTSTITVTPTSTTPVASTATNTPTNTPSNTPTNSSTNTPSDTPTNSPTQTPTDTPTPTSTNTVSSTFTPTAVNTIPTPVCGGTTIVGITSNPPSMPVTGGDVSYEIAGVGGNGVINAIHVYFYSSGATASLGLYSDTGFNVPVTQLGSTNSFTSVNGWNTVPLTIPVTVTGGSNIWFAIYISGAPSNVYLVGGAPSGGSGQLIQTGMPGLPAPNAGTIGITQAGNYLTMYSDICPVVATPTFTSTFTVSPTHTCAPTLTPTITPTPTDTGTPTNTPTPINTPTGTLTPTNSFTPTPTPTHTNTPTVTNTPTPCP